MKQMAVSIRGLKNSRGILLPFENGLAPGLSIVDVHDLGRVVCLTSDLRQADKNMRQAKKREEAHDKPRR